MKAANLAQAYVSNKRGEYFVRQHGAGARNIQSVFAQLDQPGLAQALDFVAIAFKRVHAEAPQVFIQIDAVFQPQSQKQILALSVVITEIDPLNERRLAAFDLRQIFMDVASVRPSRPAVVAGG